MTCGWGCTHQERERVCVWGGSQCRLVLQNQRFILKGSVNGQVNVVPSSAQRDPPIPHFLVYI